MHDKTGVTAWLRSIVDKVPIVMKSFFQLFLI